MGDGEPSGNGAARRPGRAEIVAGGAGLAEMQGQIADVHPGHGRGDRAREIHGLGEDLRKTATAGDPLDQPRRILDLDLESAGKGRRRRKIAGDAPQLDPRLAGLRGQHDADRHLRLLVDPAQSHLEAGAQAPRGQLAFALERTAQRLGGHGGGEVLDAFDGAARAVAVDRRRHSRSPGCRAGHSAAGPRPVRVSPPETESAAFCRRRSCCRRSWRARKTPSCCGRRRASRDAPPVPPAAPCRPGYGPGEAGPGPRSPPMSEGGPCPRRRRRRRCRGADR